MSWEIDEKYEIEIHTLIKNVNLTFSTFSMQYSSVWVKHNSATFLWKKATYGVFYVSVQNLNDQ